MSWEGNRKAFLFFPKLPRLRAKSVYNIKTCRCLAHATSRCRKLKKIYSYVFIYIFIYVSMPVETRGPESQKNGMSVWL